MNKIELLAPAGDLEKLKIAIDYGADAVYLAGELFGLRAGAKNFSIEEMEEGVAYAHERGRKVHLTLMVRFDGQCEVYVMLFLFSEYRCMVFGFDGQLGHAEGVVLFFRSQFRTFVVVVRTSCQHPWKADEAYPMSDFHSEFFLAAN